MKRYLYIGLTIYLFGGGLYLLSQCFPKLFGLTDMAQQESNINNLHLITGATEVEEYVSDLCGKECENCAQSPEKCSSLTAEQIHSVCSTKGQQNTICFYDPSKLITTCNRLCS